MNKAELIKALEPFPDTMDIFIEQTDTEFSLSLLNTVKKEKATFTGEKVRATDTVIILTDEI